MRVIYVVVHRAERFILFKISVCFSWPRDRRKCTLSPSWRLIWWITWNPPLWKFMITTRPVRVIFFFLSAFSFYPQISHCTCGVFCVIMNDLQHDFCYFSPSVGDVAVTEYFSPCPVQWEFVQDLRTERKCFLL